MTLKKPGIYGLTSWRYIIKIQTEKSAFFKVGLF